MYQEQGSQLDPRTLPASDLSMTVRMGPVGTEGPEGLGASHRRVQIEPAILLT